MNAIPTGNDADYADQQTLVRDSDRDIGPDTAALTPLAERIRAAFDAADSTDRFEQSFITPIPEDDYPLAY